MAENKTTVQRARKEDKKYTDAPVKRGTGGL